MLQEGALRAFRNCHNKIEKKKAGKNIVRDGRLQEEDEAINIVLASERPFTAA
jgi:hypothetical protein